MRKSSLVAAILFTAGCAHQPVPPAASSTKTTGVEPKAVPAEQMVDHEGDSMTTAISVPKDAPNEGIDFENEWIFGRFGRFRRQTAGIGNALGRRYEVITVELPDGSTHKVFFDVTESWNAWKPQK